MSTFIPPSGGQPKGDARPGVQDQEGGLKIELKGRIRGAAKKRKLGGVSYGGSIKSQTIDRGHIELTKKEIYTK